MPFALVAHQAPALFALRRWPSRFHGTTLVLGTLIPDLEYLRSSTPSAPGFAHSLLGQILVVAPASVALAWLTTAVVIPALVPLVPRDRAWHLEDVGVVEGVARSPAALVRALASGLVGGLSHVALDSLTHEGPVPGAARVLSGPLAKAGRFAAVPPVVALQVLLSLVLTAYGLVALSALLRERWLRRWADAEGRLSPQAAVPPPVPGRPWALALLLASAMVGGGAGAWRTVGVLRTPSRFFFGGSFYASGFLLFAVAIGTALGLAAACVVLRLLIHRPRTGDG